MNKSFKDLFFGDISFYIEKYILSSFMLYYALKNFFLISGEIAALLQEREPNNAPAVLSYYLLVRYSLLAIFNGFSGSILLFSKRPQHAPENWSAILIPLLAAYFTLAYNFLGYMPGWMTENYTPQSWLPFFIISSILFGLGGQAIALFALFHLRRSFAVFIEVRDAIVTGPYNQVRHPIYMGHILLDIGILLSNLCPAYIFLAAAHVGLLAYRARREEQVLAASDPVYKSNMERTGFLFPKLSAFTSGQPFFSRSAGIPKEAEGK
jgi:protein-S-isoprenylcysteine O-methyltransferase Ste14